MSQVAYDFSGRVALVTGAAAGHRPGVGGRVRPSRRVGGRRRRRRGGRRGDGRAGNAAGGDARFVRTDVASSEPVRQDGRRGRHRSTAGSTTPTTTPASPPPSTTSPTCPEEEWDRVQGVMLRGVYLCMKYELPHLLATGGAIVNTASGAGLVGYPGQSPYVSSKHGVLGLTKSAALEYGRRGVRVNAVCPGTVLTPMVEAAMRAAGSRGATDRAAPHRPHRDARRDRERGAVALLRRRLVRAGACARGRRRLRRPLTPCAHPGRGVRLDEHTFASFPPGGHHARRRTHPRRVPPRHAVPVLSGRERRRSTSTPECSTPRSGCACRVTRPRPSATPSSRSGPA